MKRWKRKIPELPKSLQTPLTERKKTSMIFDPHTHINMIFNLCVLGHTDNEIARVIGISATTLGKWKEKYPEVLDAIRAGKDEADGKVANALLQAALGFSHPDVQILTNRVKVRDEKGRVIEERTEPLIVPITKHYPPNVRAAIKFLEVRQPGKWGNKVEVGGNVNIHHRIDLTGLSVEELKVLKKLSEGGRAEPTIEEAQVVEYEEEDFAELVNAPLKKYKREE